MAPVTPGPTVTGTAGVATGQGANTEDQARFDRRHLSRTSATPGVGGGAGGTAPSSNVISTLGGGCAGGSTSHIVNVSGATTRRSQTTFDPTNTASGGTYRSLSSDNPRHVALAAAAKHCAYLQKKLWQFK